MNIKVLKKYKNFLSPNLYHSLPQNLLSASHSPSVQLSELRSSFLYEKFFLQSVLHSDLFHNFWNLYWKTTNSVKNMNSKKVNRFKWHMKNILKKIDFDFFLKSFSLLGFSRNQSCVNFFQVNSPSNWRISGS